MSDKKKAVDQSGLNKKQLRSTSNIPKGHENVVNEGTFGQPRLEAVPNYIQTESEHVISNKNNSWIILGRDRPRGIASGYGGRGDTQAASIDLVTGRMSANPVSDAYVDPNFRTDAARIYISQKTDIDYDFNIADGTIGSVTAKSGVGIKADGVRIIGRENIKIVTTTDSLNSHGKKLDSVGNIDLIAGNNDELLEPAVKGKQLKILLENILKQISDVNNTLCDFISAQMVFNTSVGVHTHPIIVSPSGAGTALPSIEMIPALTMNSMAIATKVTPSLVINEVNKAGLKLNSLDPWGINHILSRNVNLT